MTTPTFSSPDLVYAALSVAGRVRRHNEDAVLCQPRLGLWAVADGMGGHQCGERASALALDTLRKRIALGDGLPKAIQDAHAAILAAAQEEEGQRGMGSTLVAAQFRGEDFRLAWVGDSRAYRVRADAIEQLSRDHSWVQVMIEAGRMTPEEAARHPRRNVVTQCLGQEGPALEVETLDSRLAGDELLLLCSDGLTRELSDARIRQICAGAETLDVLVAELIEAANRMGGNDNISCIVLGLAAPPSEPVSERPRGLLGKLFKPANS